jgi:hypothetical protein
MADQNTVFSIMSPQQQVTTIGILQHACSSTFDQAQVDALETANAAAASHLAHMTNCASEGEAAASRLCLATGSCSSASSMGCLYNTAGAAGESAAVTLEELAAKVAQVYQL